MTEAHQHGEDHSKHLLLLGAAGVAGAVILAPYALPFLGIGDADTAHRIMSFIGGQPEPGFYGSGIAGTLQKGIASLPWVGNALTSTASVTVPGIGLTLAAGALTTILASTVIGIGGMMLANRMEKREKASDKIHWSKIIRTVSLATSILISLPSILTGISIGITFLADLINTQWGNQVAYAMGSNYGLGATSMATESAAGAGAVSGLMAVLPHLFTCGLALMPLTLLFFLGKKRAGTSAHPSAETNVEMIAGSPLIAGQPMQLRFRFTDATTGRVLSLDDLTTTYTKKLHLMVVDSSLTDYHHLHPVYDPTSGLFIAHFTPRMQQSYHVWQDFTRQNDSAPTHQHQTLTARSRTDIPPRIIPTNQVTTDKVSVTIAPDSQLQAEQPCKLQLTIRDPEGRVVEDLEPIMGAYAHLAGFSQDGKHFLHCHPVGLEPATATARGNGALTFHLTPEHAGMTKFFLQIRRQGEELTLPFGRYIQPPEKFAQRHAVSHAHSPAHALA
ncbi:MAG: hypothetical protein ACK5R5_00205 [Alphaproteobacteria bacterium]